jgi:hypothetical protein
MSIIQGITMADKDAGAKGRLMWHDIQYCPELPSRAERRLIRKTAGWSAQRMADEVGAVGHASVLWWESAGDPSPQFRAEYARVLAELREEIRLHKAGVA